MEKETVEETIRNIKQEPPVSFTLVLPTSTEENEEVSDKTEDDRLGVFLEKYKRNRKPTSGKNQIKIRCNHFNCHPFKCVVCEQILKCRSLNVEHLADFHGNKFECPKCPYVAKSYGLLYNHKATHEKRFSCESCGRKFSHNNILRDHQMHQKHGVYASLPEKIFTCKVCKKEFPSHYRLHAHEFIMHCPQSAHCDLCGKTVRNKEYMRRHMFQHLKAPCSICNKLISSLTIKRHILDMHTKTPSVDCQHCGKKLKNQKNLMVHVQGMHSNAFFKCNFCDRKFKRKCYLYVHVKRIHKNGENNTGK